MSQTAQQQAVVWAQQRVRDLLRALATADANAANALLDQGLSPDAWYQGATGNHRAAGVHVAAWLGHKASLEVLVRRKANINVKCNISRTGDWSDDFSIGNISFSIPENCCRGLTPLHIAAIHDHLDVVCYLMSVGADCTIANESGLTAAGCAITMGRKRIVEAIDARAASFQSHLSASSLSRGSSLKSQASSALTDQEFAALSRAQSMQPDARMQVHDAEISRLQETVGTLEAKLLAKADEIDVLKASELGLRQSLETAVQQLNDEKQRHLQTTEKWSEDRTKLTRLLAEEAKRSLATKQLADVTVTEFTTLCEVLSLRIDSQKLQENGLDGAKFLKIKRTQVLARALGSSIGDAMFLAHAARSMASGRSLPPPRTRKQTETSNIVTRAGDQRLQAAFEKHGIDDDVLFFADLAELASVDDVIAEHEDTLSGLLAASRPVPLSSAASSFLIASD
eukprot:m.768125 g.768125  ORF g.768125 m.768125 type:complete len:455 (-) comp59074_c0_seq36:3473-4837(-)